MLENLYDTSAYLVEEPENLLKQELREPALYNAIITAIANGICTQYLLMHPEQLPFPVSEIGEWWGAHPVKKKEIQLDIVAIAAKSANTSKGRQFIIGSCKYRNEPIGMD